jgi:hypothetical protein
MEFTMTNYRQMPDVSVDARLLGNLRQARLEMEVATIELKRLIAKFDVKIQDQRSERIQNSLSSFDSPKH